MKLGMILGLGYIKPVIGQFGIKSQRKAFLKKSRPAKYFTRNFDKGS